MRQILERLQEFKLFTKLLKYIFSQISVKFLEFVIDTEEIRIKPNRIRTVIEWSISCSYHDIQILLDFANFYYQFICNYFLLTTPITDLLKNSQRERKIEFF